MNRFGLFLLAAVVLSATSCCDCRKSRALEKPLEGTTWQLMQIMARDVTPAEDSFTVIFHADGNVTGMGACNSIMGRYTSSPSRDLHIDDISSTRRMCREQEAEREYIDVLDAVTHYEMDADKMLMLSNGTLVAIFMAKP